jgi:hypothetical protein
MIIICRFAIPWKLILPLTNPFENNAKVDTDGSSHAMKLGGLISNEGSLYALFSMIPSLEYYLSLGHTNPLFFLKI